jgi:putative copper export protein
MQAAPLLHWSDPVRQFVGFVASFLATGAVGFRYAAVRDRLTGPDPFAVAERTVYGDATQRAAALGLLGAIVQGVLLVMGLPGAAAHAHVSVGHLVTTDPQTVASCTLLGAAIVGLALAAVRRWSGWPVAAAGIVGGPFVGIVTGQWSRLVNPVHGLVGGLWLGTLFVLVVAGLTAVLRDEASRDRRGAIAADMVHGFSPLALTCGMLLVLSGLVTAWQHLNPLSSLWSTPYGYTLLVKLCLVAMVFGVGAWNWRRQRPLLGTEDGAIAIRRLSAMELTAATLVLVVTAILVSLPSPRPPRPPGTGTPAVAPADE